LIETSEAIAQFAKAFSIASRTLFVIDKKVSFVTNVISRTVLSTSSFAISFKFGFSVANIAFKTKSKTVLNY
jgi:hypothetical protein